MKIEAGDLVEVKALVWNHVDSPTYIRQAIVQGDEDTWGKGHYSVMTHVISEKDIIRVVKKQVIDKYLLKNFLLGELFLGEPPGHIHHDPDVLKKWALTNYPLRDWGERENHYVSVHPGIMSGSPCVDLHRITAEQMAAVWWNGSETLDSIEENWPGMNRGAVLVACWYMARYGSRTWRKRWAEWLKIAEGELWHSHYDTCPMPPQAPKAVRYLQSKRRGPGGEPAGL